MIEAVDWRHHDRFLAACAALLRPDGLAALQAIVIDDRSFARAKRHRDFVRRMVFPGGCLPSVASLTASLTGPPICASSTWRTSAATTPKPSDAGPRTWPPTSRTSTGWGPSRPSVGCGRCTWPTAKRRSSNATSVTCRW